MVGKFHLEPTHLKAHFSHNLLPFGVSEMMYLSTCNRVEFFLRTTDVVDEAYVKRWLQSNFPQTSAQDCQTAAESASVYRGLDAIRHLFHVASSLDSLIVGEREIITQVRNAFNASKAAGLTGNYIQLATQKAIETAKQVYTETNIATRPISVVNLGFKKLLERDLANASKLVFIGAGSTIEAIAGNLKSQRFSTVQIFNRTPDKAVQLAQHFGGQGFELGAMGSEMCDFDVLITCTGAASAVFTKPLYDKVAKSSKPRVILDLAIPHDVEETVSEISEVDYISIESLKEEAKQNLRFREKEIFRCEALVEERLSEFEEAFKTRKLELAMEKIPKLMKDIKQHALSQKFAKNVARMDDESRETLQSVVDYLEKKYIAVPMKMAKEIVLDKDLKDKIIE